MAYPIRLESISKRYKGITALESVSFELKPGQVFALIGPNGAGKSTTIKIICGLIEPTEGRIRVGDDELDFKELKKSIGYMPEESALYENMTVSEYLLFFSELYDVSASAARRRIGELLAFLKLEDKQISLMSKGMKRKALLARALINDPEILVFDEPASGLDPVTARSLLDRIKDLSTEGKTVLMSAHDLTQVEEVSDRILILDKGRVYMQGTTEEIKHGLGAESFLAVFGGKELRFKDKKSMIEHINKSKAELIDLKVDERRLQEIFVERFKDA